MIEIQISDAFHAICPQFIGAAIEAEVTNSPTSEALWKEIEAYIEQLRSQYTPTTIKDRSGILATRQAYKKAGKDPSRYRPACEQLARRVLQGKDLYSVDSLVDLVNLASLFSGYSTAALDREKISGNRLTLDIGTEGEPYEGIGRGPLNIANLPVYHDKIGGVATPTSDNVRTMMSPETQHLVVLINGYDGDKANLEATVQLTQDLLRRFAQSDGGQCQYYHR
ncbi:B3/4 domain-containing protein [gut metagenome]|uniref:B3/4 domain-containing protein n=1 Tax=gut metagenome TaxID=749906 RepID=J9H1Y6_9ZZZZ